MGDESFGAFLKEQPVDAYNPQGNDGDVPRYHDGTVSWIEVMENSRPPPKTMPAPMTTQGRFPKMSHRRISRWYPDRNAGLARM